MRGIETVSADALLGGRAVFARAPRSGLEWVGVVRHGISSRALDSMLKSIGLSQAELAQALSLKPDLTVKWLLAHAPNLPKNFEGLRMAGLPEE